MENKKIDNSKNIQTLDEEQKKIAYNAMLNFTKLMKQNLYDPMKSNTRKSASFSLYTKENIMQWLQSPTNNEKNLRNASIYMYSLSNHYYRLVQYYAGLLEWCYVLMPINFDNSKVKEDVFCKQYFKIAQYLENMNLKHELQKATVVALREGVFYGVRWQSKDSFFIQRIDPDYCQLSSIVDGSWNYSVDCSKIKEEELDILYPPEFTKMWNNYKDTGEKFQEVPPEISFCLKADETTNLYSIPIFSSVLPMLYDIENYKALQETATEIENYKMITGKVPVDKEGVPTVAWELVLQYAAQLAEALPDQIGSAFLPFELNDFDFKKSGGISEVDTVARANEQYWTEVGSPGVLHGAAKETSAAVKLSIKTDESLMFLLMEQAQRLMNRHLKMTSGSIKFKIKFLPVTIFNHDDMAKMYKESVAFGLGKAEYAAVIGRNPFEVSPLDYIEKTVMGMNDLTPMMSSHTMSSKDAAGRPEKDETELSPKGDKTKNTGANDNR